PVRPGTGGTVAGDGDDVTTCAIVGGQADRGGARRGMAEEPGRSGPGPGLEGAVAERTPGHQHHRTPAGIPGHGDRGGARRRSRIRPLPGPGRAVPAPGVVEQAWAGIAGLTTEQEQAGATWVEGHHPREPWLRAGGGA